MGLPWHLYLMAGIYIMAGMMHFIKPKVYLRIMPKYLPAHRALVYLSGVAEIVFGVGLLIDKFRNTSVIGILVLLTLFLSVHSYMLTEEKAAAGIPQWILWLRIPLQFGLMYWAFQYLA